MDFFQLLSVSGSSFIFGGSRRAFAHEMGDLWEHVSMYEASQSFPSQTLRNDTVPAHPGSDHCLVVYALHIQQG